jgi:hypothetical protein
MQSVRLFICAAAIGLTGLGIGWISALRAEEHECRAIHYADLPVQVCAESGFSVALERIAPGIQLPGLVSSVVVFEICSPPLGGCSSGPRAGRGCLDHNGCQGRAAPHAWCDRACAVTRFEPLGELQIRLFRRDQGRQPLWLRAQCRGIDRNRDGVFPATSGAAAQAFMVQCPNLGVEPGDCLEVGVEVATALEVPPAAICIEMVLGGGAVRLCALPACGEWGSWTFCPDGGVEGGATP